VGHVGFVSRSQVDSGHAKCIHERFTTTALRL
jgi:hypothetical protein